MYNSHQFCKLRQNSVYLPAFCKDDHCFLILIKWGNTDSAYCPERLVICGNDNKITAMCENVPYHILAIDDSDQSALSVQSNIDFLCLSVHSTIPNDSTHHQAYINLTSLKPHFYIVKLGFTGVYIIFLILLKKHRLWVLVRTASARRF